MRNITNILSSSQKKLLDLVKRHGELTVAGAVDELDLATTTVRQHFTALEDEGLVERTERAEGRGRPTAYFSLSEAALQMYPSRDGPMLSELLDFLSREGYHRAIDEFFREFWDDKRLELRDQLDEAGAETLEERLEVLGEFLDNQGFMPEIDLDDDGTVTIRECNCPLRGSVDSTHLPCRLEAEFLEHVVERVLTRVDYIPEGANACTYEFEKQGEAPE